MDKLEEIGRRLDEELRRMGRMVEEEVGPEAERRAAIFLREVSEKISALAGKLESRVAARRSSQP
jgi:hypothetical protein